jgi:hypothetical protein
MVDKTELLELSNLIKLWQKKQVIQPDLYGSRVDTICKTI